MCRNASLPRTCLTKPELQGFNRIRHISSALCRHMIVVVFSLFLHFLTYQCDPPELIHPHCQFSTCSFCGPRLDSSTVSCEIVMVRTRGATICRMRRGVDLHDVAHVVRSENPEFCKKSRAITYLNWSHTLKKGILVFMSI